MEKTKMPDGLVFLNYKTTPKETLPKADTLPTLISDETFNALREGDENREPLMITEAIDYPVEGAGGIYTEEFFNSFLNRLKVHPFGGNKLGHSWPERDDFFTIGGKIKKSETEKGKGTVYFKLYVPHFGFETTNFGFIRNVKAKNQHYSLVTRPKGELRKDSNGEYKMHFIESISDERNDAVPFEGGAMRQRVNSKLIGVDFEELKTLVTNGKYSRKNIDDEIIQNGKVSYPVLRAMHSHADCEHKTEVGMILSMIDKASPAKTSNGRKLMNDELQEAVARVQNAAANGSIVIADVFKNAGIALRTEDDKKNEELVKALNAKNLGADPLKEIDSIIAQNKANADAIVKNEVATVFGAEKVKNAKGEEVENPAYTYAFEKCAGKTGDALKNEIESLKNSAVMKGIRANQADPFSKINMIENGGASTFEPSRNSVNGIPVIGGK